MSFRRIKYRRFQTRFSSLNTHPDQTTVIFPLDACMLDAEGVFFLLNGHGTEGKREHGVTVLLTPKTGALSQIPDLIDRYIA